MKILIFTIILIVITSLIIIESNNFDITQKIDRTEFSQIYNNWINGIYQNIISLTGNAVKLYWLPEQNSSQSHK